MTPPAIRPVDSAEADRPFWSVMIPAFNPNPQYLEQTLGSVLAASAGDAEMQIELLDNASDNCDVEALVRRIAGERVNFHRHSTNIGGLENWNACIERARGKWVHILHADDLVIDGFYSKLREGLEGNDSVGAAFCRHSHITADGEPVYISDLEREEPGVLPDWVQRLALRQRIQCAAMVVRRSVYEHLGGFWSEPGTALDWEMWMRISAVYPVWYHPEVMACYRLHATSGTSTLIETAAITRDMGHAMDIVRSYLPAGPRDELNRLGKQHYARCAFQNAQGLAEQGRHAAAAAHVREALILDPTPEARQLADGILSRLPNSTLPPYGPQAAISNGQDFFSKEEIENIEMLIKAYRENPPDGAEALKALRIGIGDFLLHETPDELEALFASDFGKVYRLMLGSGVQNEPLDKQEAWLANSLAGDWRGTPEQKGNFDLRSLLAYMLFHLAHHASVPLALESVPDWFLDDYLAWLLYAPLVASRPSEAELYHLHILDCARSINERINKDPQATLTLKAALYFTQRLNVIPFYFTRANLKEVMSARASIMEFTLEKNGADLHAKLPPRPASRHKIKVGFLNAHFGRQTETYTTLPNMKLDRDRFEVCLFALQTSGDIVEKHCREKADQFVQLPSSVTEQVCALREAALDVLIIGTNMTAVTNKVALLALHRLAPVQIATYNSPLTTGMRHVAGYLTGRLAGFEGASDHHTEKLLHLEGSPSGFDFSVDASPARMHFDRNSLGIPNDAIVFVSAATCYKIIPEMQETWAKILKAVGNSYLLLIPFNPNWASGFPVKQFERSLRNAFERNGLETNRFILAPSLPNRSEVMQVQKLGDIYLDTFPFTGSISMVDPLELGLPTVVMEADTQRSRLAASMLRELQLPELVTTSGEAYIKLAIRLATDTTYRLQIREKLTFQMSNAPPFLDCDSIGKQLGAILEDLVALPSLANIIRDAVDAPALVGKAMTACSSGRLCDAEAYCRKAIETDPRNAEAWHLLGILSHRCGASDRAVEFFDQALELNPGNATYWCDLSEAHRASGECSKAIESCRRALQIQPEFPEALVNLASALKHKGEVKESMLLFQRALRLKPDLPDGLVQYGLALLEEKLTKEAVFYLKKACAAAPTSVEAHYHLAVAFERNGQYRNALKSFEKAAELNPQVAAVWHGWGRLLLSLEDYTMALKALREAVRLHACQPDFNYDYAHALQLCRRYNESLSFYENAIKNGLNTPELYNNRGVVLKDLGKLREAAQSFSQAILLKPGMVSALNNLGAVCSDLGLVTEALECFQHVIHRQPDSPGTLSNIGRLLKDRGEAARAIEYYQRSLQLRPDLSEAHDNFLFCLNYLSDMEPCEVFEKHRQWGLNLSKRIRPAFKHGARSVYGSGKLRIGYVSPDFCQHPVGAFIEPLFGHHDRDHFEVIAYSDVRSPDAVTERLKKLSDLWRHTADLSHRALAQAVWNDRIDILVDLSGHTALNRLEMFALKPAPVQVSYLGYPATTGLPAMDYRLTDILSDPPGTTDHLHTERLMHLNACAWCYQAPGERVEVLPPPSEGKGYVTFGCYNQMAKLNPRLFELWVALLHKVPESHLKLKARTLQDFKVKSELSAWFMERGISGDRLEFSGYTPTIRAHLEEYHQVDIALDSFPYHGTTTTCEALWMGVPVVSLAGQTHVSRVGVSLLNAAGLPEAVAFTPEGYVDSAAKLAKDAGSLHALRMGLRNRMAASPLMDPKAFAVELEQCFRQMLADTSRKPGAALNPTR